MDSAVVRPNGERNTFLPESLLLISWKADREKSFMGPASGLGDVATDAILVWEENERQVNVCQCQMRDSEFSDTRTGAWKK